MNRKTALSAAAAMTMSSAAAVSALFLTVGQGADASAPIAEPLVRTEYEIVRLDSPGVDRGNALQRTGTATPGQITIYETDYIAADPTAALSTGAQQYDDDDYWDDDYEEGDYYEGDDDYEDGDDYEEWDDD